mmetsp:Transcript_21874/g.33916  ORF Transcript_21874/g.33916 Transcript_21874/m.33916 type:complete len:114 (+) Transcript_21874:425-766(+)
MWSAALGYPIPMNRRYIERIFHQFAQGKEIFEFQDFRTQMTQQPDMLAWFSKPEEAMNKRLNNRIDETLITKQQMLDKVFSLKQVSFKHIDDIREKLTKMQKIFQHNLTFEDL